MSICENCANRNCVSFADFQCHENTIISHAFVCILQHVPRINNLIPTYTDANFDHQTLLERLLTEVTAIILWCMLSCVRQKELNTLL